MRRATLFHVEVIVSGSHHVGLAVAAALAAAALPSAARKFHQDARFSFELPKDATITQRRLPHGNGVKYDIIVHGQPLFYVYVGYKPAFPFFASDLPDWQPADRDRILRSVRDTTIAGRPAKTVSWTSSDGS